MTQRQTSVKGGVLDPLHMESAPNGITLRIGDKRNTLRMTLKAALVGGWYSPHDGLRELHLVDLFIAQDEFFAMVDEVRAALAAGT